MVLPLDDFQQRIAGSGLISAEELGEFIASLADTDRPSDSQQLTKLLVQAKLLTDYQAQEVSKGNGSGLVLGNYVILDKLGQGGMGLVLKARHKRMDRVVALKVLSPAFSDKPDALSRFHREAKAAARLTHPNIVTAYDADEAGGTHFLVMEYVEGHDLSQLAKRAQPVTVTEAVACTLQAAKGLAYAHSRGVIHRDIKPSNLLLDKSGTVKILDMGLARIEDKFAAGNDLTRSGEVMGTIDYMAPEQTEDTRKADHRSDIYSLGCSLYKILTGLPVYRGQTIMSKMLAHRDQPIPSLRTSRQDVSPELDFVFRKMIAKKPEERQQSMNEVLADLTRCPVYQLMDSTRCLLDDVRPDSPTPQDAQPFWHIDPAASTRELEFSDTLLKKAGSSAPQPGEIEPLNARGKIGSSAATSANPLRVRSRASKRSVLLAVSALAIVGVLLAFVTVFFRGNSHRDRSAKMPEKGSGGSVREVPVPPLAQVPLPPEFTNGQNMKFVLLPCGTARLGGGGGKPGETRAEISYDVYLGRYEVTQGEWEDVLGKDKNPSHFSRAGDDRNAVVKFSDDELRRFPVDSVSWNQCQEFISRLNERHPEPGWQYRLPTKVEWEYACRGGSSPNLPDYGFDYYLAEATNTLPLDKVNCKLSVLGRTCPVGSFDPNRLGLYDMHGNVMEYCNEQEQRNSETLILIRGGSWHDPPEFCSAGRISLGTPDAGFMGCGLRLALVRVTPGEK